MYSSLALVSLQEAAFQFRRCWGFFCLFVMPKPFSWRAYSRCGGADAPGPVWKG